MSKKELSAGLAFAEALRNLPDDKKEYFFGYADGVQAAVEAQKDREEEEHDRNDDAGEGR